MPEISAAQRPKIAKATIDLGEGENLNVTFDRNKVTRELLEQNERDVDFSNVLSDLIISWDLLENGQPLPITPKTFARLSIPVQSDIFRALMTRAVPASEEGNVSSAPSSSPVPGSTEPAATSQNGQETSPLPSPSASPSPT